jgi:hypothetical protein
MLSPAAKDDGESPSYLLFHTVSTVLQRTGHEEMKQ